MTNISLTTHIKNHIGSSLHTNLINLIYNITQLIMYIDINSILIRFSFDIPFYIVKLVFS